jgi:hypothetical protein
LIFVTGSLLFMGSLYDIRRQKKEYTKRLRDFEMLEES